MNEGTERIWMTSIPEKRPKTPRLVDAELCAEADAHPEMWTIVRDFGGTKDPSTRARQLVKNIREYSPPLPLRFKVDSSRGVVYLRSVSS